MENILETQEKLEAYKRTPEGKQKARLRLCEVFNEHTTKHNKGQVIINLEKILKDAKDIDNERKSRYIEQGVKYFQDREAKLTTNTVIDNIVVDIKNYFLKNRTYDLAELFVEDFNDKTLEYLVEEMEEMNKNQPELSQ